MLGDYELHIKTELEHTMTMRASTLCNKIRFDGLQQQNTTIECNTAMVGNTIILKRTDKGYLRLFELYPIGNFSFKCTQLSYPNKKKLNDKHIYIRRCFFKRSKTREQNIK